MNFTELSLPAGFRLEQSTERYLHNVIANLLSLLPSRR